MDSKRCPCWTQHPLMREYHDNEWGRPVHSDRKHFEMIVLEVMQCGLNWLMILQKREVFRRCFQEFSPEKAAAFTEEDVERILGTEGMIRSARKIRAVIQNAQKFLEIAAEYGSFDNYLWGFTGGKTLIYPENIPEPFPAKNKLSDEISRDLKKRGFQYLGSLTVYAHLQACGLINDHDRSCPMFKQSLPSPIPGRILNSHKPERMTEMSDKIQMKTPLVEMDGDEMTRIMWQMIKDILLLPYIDLKTEYYDLGLVKRNETNDQITIDAANATKKYGVAVKCATITPNAARMPEYNLKEMWKSPNGTIRAMLDGTVFRAPIIVKGITPFIPTWTKPITIARHAYGDIYKNSEMKVDAGCKAELLVTDKNGNESRQLIHDFKTPGIIQGVHNVDESIASFARSCMNFALDTKQDLWFATKDTISKTYDHRFKDIFAEVYEQEYKEKFEAAGIEYFYTLIDDAVARVIRSEGGYIWACKNYDGDVMSDMVATAFGSLGLMTSVLVSPDGVYEYEAAHGTVQRHYYKHLKGEKTSSNSMATIFAWTGALRKRGELDNLPELCDFADKLEKASIQTIEEGVMTGDLIPLCSLENKQKVDTETFLREIDSRLKKLL